MGKAALVTGGARGIGRAIVRRLAAEGWSVAVLDREAPEPALDAHLVLGDVADEPAVRRAIEAVLAAFGRLDAIVSNAGVMVRQPVTALPLAEWQRVLATNLTGAFLLAKHGAEALRPRGGSLLLVASSRAHQSEPDTEAYSASKGGLVALTHALAVSLGPAVRVNCISPGWIDTAAGEPLSEADHAQHPAGRVGRPEDVAGLASFLLGPDAGFITGAEFLVDGGMTRKMIYA